MYQQDREEFAFLYENVIFTNISAEKMKNFFNIFDFNDMTCGLWNRICERMEKEIKDQYLYINVDRYKRKFTKHLDLINNKNYKLNKVKNLNSVYSNQYNPPPLINPLPTPPPPPPPPPLPGYQNQDDDDDDDSDSTTW